MPYSLVIVDDDYEIRNGLTQYFPWNDIGFKVVAAFEDAETLFSYLLTHTVDVVLCDIKLPKMSGIEVAQKLRESNNSVRFVFLSAYSDYDFMRSALQLHAVDYILKPTDYHELSSLFISIKRDFDEQHMVSAEAEKESETHIPVQQKLIEAVKTYLKINYRGATLASAAEVVKINPNYLSRFFKEQTSESFSDYLMKIRMEKAKELLNDYTLRVCEVSDMIGYSDSNNFSRAFTRYYGKSPRDFRSSGNA